MSIKVINLTKKYRDLTAISELSFQVKENSIHGLIGVNGSGKTTTIKSILNFINYSGDISVFNEELNDELKEKIGYLPENLYFLENLTVYETLHFFGDLFNSISSEKLDERIQYLIDLLELKKYENKKLNELSKGYKQRIGIAQALINDPEILILDEPTTGLDPVGKQLIHGIIMDLKKKNKTILISSHHLLELETICDEITIIHKSKHIETSDVKSIQAKKEYKNLQEYFIKKVETIENIKKSN